VRQAVKNRWRRARHSLGARLTGLFLLLALAVTLSFVLGMQAALRYGWQDYARPLLAHYVDTLAEHIGTPPDPERAAALSRQLPLRIQIDGPRVNWSSHPDGGLQPWRRMGHTGRETQRDPNPWQPERLLADGHRIRFGLASPARDVRDVNDPRDPAERPRLIGWATLATLLLLVALAYWRVRRLLHPLADIRAGALRYGQGDFSKPIVPRRYDELGDLAQHINRMADGLHGLLDAKRELLLAISHELRSPLTRARVNAELVDDSPARDALLQDLGEMRDLVTDLLESERLAPQPGAARAAAHTALHTAPTDLNALLHELLATRFTGTRTDLALADKLPLLPLDATRIKLLLRNLLDNALRHSVGADRPPHISTVLAADGHSVQLTVRDHGPGVDPAHLPHLTQAFYRADSARQRSTGGVGLGLHLCALVAQAHGGGLTIRNAQPGLEVVVTLPVRAPAQPINPPAPPKP
jgi:signal transduction histidine kinase